MTVGRNVAAILFLFVTLIRGHPFRMEEIDRSSGLYFEETGKIFFYDHEWKIVVNINLTKYHTELNNIHSKMNAIISSCDELKQIEVEKNVSAKGSEGCGAVLYKLRLLMADIEENDFNWFGNNNSRMKRNVISELVSDDRMINDHFSFFQRFTNMAANGDETSTVTQNQTSYIMSTMNSFGKLSENDRISIDEYISNHLSVVHNTLLSARNGSASAVRLFQLKSTIQEIISYQTLILTTFASRQKSYLDMISLVGVNNVPISSILPVHPLLNELNNIRNIVSENGLGFPMTLTSENIQILMRQSSPEIASFRDQIFVTFQLPLISKLAGNYFTLLKVTSSLTPLYGNTYSYIIPTHQFIAIDVLKERYVPLTIDDLNNCRQMADAMICKQIAPATSTLTSSDCEVSMLMKREYPIKSVPIRIGDVRRTYLIRPDDLQLFLPLNAISNCNERYIRNNAEIFTKVLKPNGWLVTMPKAANIRYICDGQPIADSFVQLNGLLTIDPNCKFSIGNVVLIGQKIFSKNLVTPRGYGNFTSRLDHQREVGQLIVNGGIIESNEIARVINFGENEKLSDISHTADDISTMLEAAIEWRRFNVEFKTAEDTLFCGLGFAFLCLIVCFCIVMVDYIKLRLKR